MTKRSLASEGGFRGTILCRGSQRTPVDRALRAKEGTREDGTKLSDATCGEDCLIPGRDARLCVLEE